MSIKHFSETNRLNWKLDECGEHIIPGKAGHIYADATRMGVYVVSTPKKWGNARRAFEGAGFRIHQNGDFEGTALFEAGNPEQLKLAMRYARIKHRRKLSPEQLENARRALESFRQKRSGAQG
jgi:hypothetical protein